MWVSLILRAFLSDKFWSYYFISKLGSLFLNAYIDSLYYDQANIFSIHLVYVSFFYHCMQSIPLETQFFTNVLISRVSGRLILKVSQTELLNTKEKIFQRSFE